MKRKLVKQGQSTLMISLPAKWIKENNLSKGSEIDLEIIKGNLHIIPTVKKEKKKEIRLKLNNLTESAIRTLITNTYRKGYELVDVEFDNETQYQVLSKVVKNKLIGFDILEKKDKKCVVENITEPSSEQFENIMLKVFFNIKELLDITKKRFSGELDLDYQEVEERIVGYDNFCRRVIAKNNSKNLLWTFLTLINHAQRELYHLNKYINKKQSKGAVELLEDCENIFSLIKEAFYKKDLKTIEIVHELEKRLIYNKGRKLLKKENDPIVIYHIMVSIREFYQSNSPLAGIIME